jgi:uncharacterized protein (TIGR03067 family)
MSVVGAAFCLLALTAAHADPASAKKPDKEDIQGAWTAVSINSSGEEVPKEQLDKMQLVLRFTDAKYTMENAAAEVKKQGGVKLDDGKTPKEIDLTPADGPGVSGIYELDGDTLKICTKSGSHMAERPTEIKPGMGIDIVTFRRNVKP